MPKKDLKSIYKRANSIMDVSEICSIRPFLTDTIPELEEKTRRMKVFTSSYEKILKELDNA